MRLESLTQEPLGLIYIQYKYFFQKSCSVVGSFFHDAVPFEDSTTVLGYGRN